MNIRDMNTVLWIASSSISNTKKNYIYDLYNDKEELFYNIVNYKLNKLTLREMEELIRSFNKETISNIIDKIKEQGLRYVLYGEEHYPKEFYNIEEPPFIIFYKGDLEVINERSVSIVGSRNCTYYGKEVTKYIVKELSQYNVNTVSGGARGIDSIAHLTSIENNSKTLAVLGCGIDIVYPRENAKLFKDIEKNGLVISEFLPGTPPINYNFPQRNRIISALGEVVVVIEGSNKSGTLITASHALKQGKDVMAVPGPIYSELSKGCNKLIRDGAYPFTEIEDILSLLKIHKNCRRLQKENNKSENNTLKERIYNIIMNEPMHIDTIIKITNIDIKVLYELLFELQFEERILALSGNFYVKAI
ncbi:DNA-processing protein DprA [Clostridium sp.]|uniref:DNA-processing protein DprA n=1 Tax=Clostridium sp. TaxID=1506 RepID=UPI003463F20F